MYIVLVCVCAVHELKDKPALRKILYSMRILHWRLLEKARRPMTAEHVMQLP